MADKKEGVLSLQAEVGSSSLTRDVGPALGQRGINIMEFCNQFNDLTKDMEKGAPIPVQVIYKNKKIIEMKVKSPPTSYLVKKALGLEKGSTAPGRESVGSVKMADLESVAKTKMKDMGAPSVEAALNMVRGTALSMGIKVE